MWSCQQPAVRRHNLSISTRLARARTIEIGQCVRWRSPWPAEDMGEWWVCAELVRREFTVDVPVQRAWDHLANVNAWTSWAKHIKR